MKKRNIVSICTLVFVGLFTSCSDLFNFDLFETDFKEPVYTAPVAPVAPAPPQSGTEITVPGTSLAAKLTWIKANATSGNTYIVGVIAEYEEFPDQIPDQTLSTLFYNYKNITIQLMEGNGGMSNDCGCSNNGYTSDNPRVIALRSLSDDYPLFNIGYGVTLIVDDNILLMGGIRVNSGGSLIINGDVRISRGKVSVDGGTFTMNDGEISDTTIYSWESGGGVYVRNGTFTMNGGKITGNTSRYYAGGVHVASNGTFTMKGGEISGNKASECGGGVSVNGGTFTMNGGKISGNRAEFCTGGVYVINNGSFTMNNGEISGNSSSWDSAGGVFVYGGTFTLKKGKISGNTATSGGGGVAVNGGKFTMSGGEISGNTVTYSLSNNGGGVWVRSGIFEMSNGEIYGNTAVCSDSYSCGGVYVDGNYVNYFSKTGGTIYGNTGDGKGNVVKDFTTGDVLNDKSHAVYVHNTTSAYIKQRHTTARAADRLSYIGRLNLLPVWSGDWD